VDSTSIPVPEPGIRTEKVLRRAHPFHRPFDRLFAPVDIAPLVFFRITFGLLMILEVVGYTVAGLVRHNWVRPEIHFTYFGFGWVPGLGDWTYALVALCLLAAFGIMLGAWYRISAAIFAFGFSWFYLIEQSNYMNHFYLICLLAFVAFAIPANRAFSIDTRRNPEKRASTVPAWTLLLLQAHIAIAYFFGGLAKLNSDWLRGEPIRTWIHEGAMGRNLPSFFHNEYGVYALSYGGLLFDLLVVPLLIWRKTRWLALAAALFFHLSNAYLFNIGVFPFLSIAMTLLFLDPAWHRKLLRLHRSSAPAKSLQWGARSFVLPALALYFTWQLFLPFRHWLYPGNVHWTEEGHRYSWHMMLRTKSAHAYFILEDRQNGTLWRIRPEFYLSRRQFRKMSVHPEMLLQFAQYLRKSWTHDNVAVYAVSLVSLNDHPPALLVDPQVDLSREKLTLAPSTFILPFQNNRSVPGRFRWAKDFHGKLSSR
jgi:hypothetical protein